MMEVPPGHVRALLERPSDPVLVDAANQLLRGHDPTETMSLYSLDPERVPSDFTVDPSFGAIRARYSTRRWHRPEGTFGPGKVGNIPGERIGESEPGSHAGICR